MTYYIGTENSLSDLLGAENPRFFYALRRDDEGLLFFSKVDQIKDDDVIIINKPGLSQNDFSSFEYGVDFFDGRLEEDHSRPFTNLYWDQYRWDNRNLFYYINEEGEFVVRINRAYNYPPELIVT